MKKAILTLVIALGMSTAFAQNSLTSKLSQVAEAATTKSNYTTQASAISSQLNSILSLKNTQKPHVASIVTDYLKSKAGLSSLVKTNKSAYASKLSGLNSNMLAKMKSALTAVQYAKLLGLRTSPTVDALSALFI